MFLGYFNFFRKNPARFPVGMRAGVLAPSVRLGLGPIVQRIRDELDDANRQGAEEDDCVYGFFIHCFFSFFGLGFMLETFPSTLCGFRNEPQSPYCKAPDEDQRAE